MSEHVENDPLGEFGPNQKSAVVWFFSVVAIGLAMVYILSGIDRTMYDTDAEFIDYSQYNSNRIASHMLATDTLDERQEASVTEVRANVAK